MVRIKAKELGTDEIIELEIPYADLLYKMDVLRQIEIDGKVYQRIVSAEPPITPKAEPRAKSGSGLYPYFSDAMGVHPIQIEEAKAVLRALGVRVEYTPDGRAIIESPQHRKQLAEAMGLHDRNSYGTRYEARYKPYRVV